MKKEHIKLSEIQPSQLYLCRDKLKNLEVRNEDLEPLPVRRIGDRLFFTDGHHRAYELLKNGRKNVEVYKDDEDLGWLEYMICVDWCEKEGIKEISDLEGRIVNEEKFREKWIGKCEEMHKKIDNDIFENFINFINVSEENIKSEVCETILRALPGYFGIEEAVEDYVEGVKDKYFLSVNLGDIPVGFVSLKEHNEFTAEIFVMGLFKELQGRGIGKKMMENVEEYLLRQGKIYLTVKTLGPSREDDGLYDKTRGFYRSVGFIPLEEFKELWDENNPCLFMVKKIGGKD